MAKEKRVRKRKTRADAPGADGAGIGDNSEEAELTPDERRALFLTHRTSWNEYQAKLKAVETIGDEVKAALKSDGFTIKMMKIADQLADVKGEAVVKSEVEDRLKVARWLGHPLGAQLDLFEQPDRRPATEVAFENGKTAGMEGRVRKPPHSPEVPQYEEWMRGWYEGQKLLGKKFSGAEATMGAENAASSN
jgi:hypothetical protein